MEEKRTVPPASRDKALFSYKQDAIQAATDLRYGFKVVQAIQNAETHGEVQRIMIAARHAKFGID